MYCYRINDVGGKTIRGSIEGKTEVDGIEIMNDATMAVRLLKILN